MEESYRISDSEESQLDARLRSWVFTYNNYTEEGIKRIEDFITKNCAWGIYGKEIGEKGTPHLQGAMHFENQRKGHAINNKTGRVMWLHGMNGTFDQARTYCMKDNNFWEHGTMPQQGKRSDMEDVREIVMKTGRMREVAKKATTYHQLLFGEKILRYLEPKRDWKPNVRWYWGPPGVGKSRRAMEEAGTEKHVQTRNLRWWDSYDGHENVVMDEFRGSWGPLHELLTLIDRYPHQVETKGGMRQFLARNIWITSCKHPSECYDVKDEDIDQLTRRISLIELIEKISEVPEGNIEGTSESPSGTT